jgi:hypothetical protein
MTLHFSQTLKSVICSKFGRFSSEGISLFRCIVRHYDFAGDAICHVSSLKQNMTLVSRFARVRDQSVVKHSDHSQFDQMSEAQ